MNRRRVLLVGVPFSLLTLMLCLAAVIDTATHTPRTPRFVPAPTTPQLSRTHTQAAATPTPSRTTKQHGSIGVSDNLGHLPTTVLHARLRILQRAGVTWLRKDIEWRGAERTQGNYNWDANDPTVAAAQQFGIQPTLILGYAPDWAAGQGQTNCAVVRCSPADSSGVVAAFAKFAAATARHYCAAPYRVRTFEIWNEPNLHKYWPNPNAKRYVTFLNAASAAIKATGCKATVLLGGLGDSACTPCVSSAEFLHDVYAAGGKQAFDHVSNHPYIQGAPTAATWQPAVLHRIMARHGDSHKQVWVTEFAYSSKIGAQQQAQLMQAAIATFRDYPWSGPLFWFSLQDKPGGEAFGLIDQSGQPKPALGVLGTLARTG